MGCHTRVADMTAHAMQGDRERCLEAGFDSDIAEPVRQSDLKVALQAIDRRDQLALQPVVDGLKDIFPMSVARLIAE
jgi:CheY-like chemotaxis protein